MELKIFPYYENDGMRTFRDSDIMALYDRMVQDNTANTVFSTGDIKDRVDFLRYMRSPGTLLYLLEVDKELVAITWLNRREHKSAFNHFCVFSNFWGKDTVALGKATLTKLINMADQNGFVFDVFFGMVPASNERAIKFAQACGGVKLGTVPYGIYDGASGCQVDAVSIYYTRETCDASIQDA